MKNLKVILLYSVFFASIATGLQASEVELKNSVDSSQETTSVDFICEIFPPACF